MKENTIYCGDSGRVLGDTMEFPDNSIDLIYLDPPFFSDRHYEVIWGDGYEIRAFEDRWKGGVENYIAWMEPKLLQCHRVLKPTGSIYLHCDWHADAHLRILMDKIFGENHFQNEIIWSYQRWTGATNKFQRMHDVILFYTKEKKGYTFNLQKEPYSEKSLHKARRTSIAKDGKVVSQTYTNDTSREKSMRDVWEISYLNSQSKERLGYPTQKPEALLERIIKASSNEGDIVLDPFCGCGTALSVAQKLHRKWIGIDVSPTACKLISKRMNYINPAFKVDQVIGLPKTKEEILAMQPFEFQNWAVRKLEGRMPTRLTGDMGVDGYMKLGDPIQVKQSEHVGREVVDSFETAMKRSKKKLGIIVAISFTKGSYEEVARAKNDEGLEIELMTVDDIMALP